MTTPIGKAKQLLSLLETAASSEGLALPTPRYALLGETVITCASVTVALARLDPAGPEYNFGNCLTSQIGTFSISIARGCGVVYDDEGIDIPPLVEDASLKMSLDGDFLWNFAAGLDLYLQKDWAMTWSLPGGMLISTLNLTAGVD